MKRVGSDLDRVVRYLRKNKRGTIIDLETYIAEQNLNVTIAELDSACLIGRGFVFDRYDKVINTWKSTNNAHYWL